MPRRKMSWVLIGWTVLFGAWIIAGVSDRASEACEKGDQLCQDASDAGTAIGVGLVFGLWAVGFVVLSLIWLMTRPRRRLCPACGREAKKGQTVCSGCGRDFGAAARSGA